MVNTLENTQNPPELSESEFENLTQVTQGNVCQSIEAVFTHPVVLLAITKTLSHFTGLLADYPKEKIDFSLEKIGGFGDEKSTERYYALCDIFKNEKYHLFFLQRVSRIAQSLPPKSKGRIKAKQIEILMLAFETFHEHVISEEIPASLSELDLSMVDSDDFSLATRIQLHPTINPLAIDIANSLRNGIPFVVGSDTKGIKISF